MNTRAEMITDISAELDKEFGKPGTPEREKFDKEAYTYYVEQTISDNIMKNGTRFDLSQNLSELHKN